jgi:hypothetical protein
MPKFTSFNYNTLKPFFPASTGIRIDDYTPLHLEDAAEKPREILGSTRDPTALTGRGGRMTSTLAVPRLRRSQQSRGAGFSLSEILEVSMLLTLLKALLFALLPVSNPSIVFTPNIRMFSFALVTAVVIRLLLLLEYIAVVVSRVC